VVRKGERTPYSRPNSWWRASRDIEYVRNGMPTYGLWVWLPDRRKRSEAERAERLTHIRELFSQRG